MLAKAWRLFGVTSSKKLNVVCQILARLRHLTDPAFTQLLLHLPEDALLGLTDEQRLQDIAEALTHRPSILTPPPIG